MFRCCVNFCGDDNPVQGVIGFGEDVCGGVGQGLARAALGEFARRGGDEPMGLVGRLMPLMLSPPKGPSAEALMLWDHKIPLWPSVPSSGPELVLTELGDQQVRPAPTTIAPHCRNAQTLERMWIRRPLRYSKPFVSFRIRPMRCGVSSAERRARNYAGA
jgi:hypothetical protein